MDRYLAWMDEAIALARAAEAGGDVPIGALVVSVDGVIVGRGHNRREVDHDPTGHAEIIAIREAAQALGSWRLDGATLVVTLEPCVMCAGAILQSRISRVVFGAWDEKAGAAGGRIDVIREAGLPHDVEVVGGIQADATAMMLANFFASRR